MRMLFTVAMVTAGLAATPMVARAGDGESAASVGAGYATFAVPDGDDGLISPTGGVMLSAQYERGFGEAYSFRVEGAMAGYVGAGTAFVGLVDLGLVYRFDVLKYVPYAFAVIGGMVGKGGVFTGDLDDDGEQDCDPGLAGCAGGFEPLIAIGGGIDILKSREASWGVEVRASALVGDTALITAGLRYTRRWGFF